MRFARFQEGQGADAQYQGSSALIETEQLAHLRYRRDSTRMGSEVASMRIQKIQGDLGAGNLHYVAERFALDHVLQPPLAPFKKSEYSLIIARIFAACSS